MSLPLTANRIGSVTRCLRTMILPGSMPSNSCMRTGVSGRLEFDGKARALQPFAQTVDIVEVEAGWTEPLRRQFPQERVGHYGGKATLNRPVLSGMRISKPRAKTFSEASIRPLTCCMTSRCAKTKFDFENGVPGGLEFPANDAHDIFEDVLFDFGDGAPSGSSLPRPPKTRSITGKASDISI